MGISFDGGDDYFTIGDDASMTLPNDVWCVGIWSKATQALDNDFLVSTGAWDAQPSINFAVDNTAGGTYYFAVCDADTIHYDSWVEGNVGTGGDNIWRLWIGQRAPSNVFEMWTCDFGSSAVRRTQSTWADIGIIDCADWLIGAELGGGNPWYSEACEFFKGNFSLSSEEITALGAGVPIWALGHTLDVYLPMHESVATLKDLVGSNDAARSSAPTTAEHPPILTLGGPMYVEYEVAAPPAGNPWYAYAQM